LKPDHPLPSKFGRETYATPCRLGICKTADDCVFVDRNAGWKKLDPIRSSPIEFITRKLSTSNDQGNPPRHLWNKDAFVVEERIGCFCAANGTMSDCREFAKMLDSASWRHALSRLWILKVYLMPLRSRQRVYEAAVLAVRTFRQHHCHPGELNKIEVEIRSSITHTVTLKKIHSWLEGGAKSPSV